MLTTTDIVPKIVNVLSLDSQAQSRLHSIIRESDLQEKMITRRKTKSVEQLTPNAKGIYTRNITLHNGKRKSIYSKDPVTLQKKVEEALQKDREEANLEALAQGDLAALTKLKEALSQTQEPAQQEHSSTASQLTFHQLWLSYIRRTEGQQLVKPQTIASYKNIYTRIFADSSLCDSSYISLSTDFVAAEFKNIFAKNKSKSDFTLALFILQQIQQEATILGIESGSLDLHLLKLKLKKLQRSLKAPHKEAFTDEEQEALETLTVQHMQQRSNSNKPAHYLLLMNWHLGLRIGELAALEVSDYDPSTHTLSVSKTELRYKDSKGNQVYTLGPTKSEAGTRVIPLNAEAQRWLECLLDYRAKRNITNPRLLALTSGNAHPKLYSTELSALATHINKAAGLEPRQFTVHAQRRTLASRLVFKGASMNLVAKTLGHSSFKTTQKYYIKPMAEDLEQWREVLSL